ncbi:MAG: hypothetical protein KDA65_07235 [Planctomycetaceae bacterium]|nr:hypothetical protein [Planctomycetaceae bacterium]
MKTFVNSMTSCFLSAITVVSLFGCGSKQPEYMFEFHDFRGAKDLDQSLVLLDWGEADFVSGPSSTFGVSNDPWPAKAKFTWQDRNGNPLGKELEVDLPKIDPERWQEVYIILVSFLPNDQVVVKELTLNEWEDVNFTTKVLAQGQPAYSVAMQNNTGEELNKSSVRFGEYYVFPESIIPDPAATRMNMNGWGIGHGYPHPITNTAVVRWTTPDGKTHEQEVEMKEKLPEDLDYQTLCFSIESDNTVTFQVRPTDDRKTWMYEGSPWTNPF